jgi:anti-anti-sigma factor
MTDLKLSREGARAELAPSGDIVASSVADLRLALRGLCADGVRELVLDLSQVGLVDSSGLGLLIATHNSLSKAGGTLAVVGASDDLLGLFRTMRMHQYFRISGGSGEDCNERP